MKISAIETKNEYGLSFVEIRGCEEFETAHVFECGQCFRWNFLHDSSAGGDMFFGVAGGKAVAVSTFSENGKKVIVIANSTLQDFNDFWCDYFDFKRDYAEIINILAAKDEYLKKATEFGKGIRILRQEKFETLISFILSANNNIPRIKGCVEKICRDYGEKIEISQAFKMYIKEKTDAEVGDVYAFPSAERLINVKAEDYSLCCRAGYRCAYLEKTVELYTQGNGLPEDSVMRELSLSEARERVKSFSGVGPKVADCILLFAGLRTDVFPVDVWVRRVLKDLYFNRDVSQKEAESFATEYFGDLAGFAQQYLFYSMRENTGK